MTDLDRERLAEHLELLDTDWVEQELFVGRAAARMVKSAGLTWRQVVSARGIVWEVANHPHAYYGDYHAVVCPREHGPEGWMYGITDLKAEGRWGRKPRIAWSKDTYHESGDAKAAAERELRRRSERSLQRSPGV
jgi:hypothetical protein